MALIGNRNIKNTYTFGRARVLEKFTKKVLDTGDIIILKDESLGMFISGKDLKDSDYFVDQQYVCKDGIIIFANWYRQDEFEYCDVNDYDNDINVGADLEELSVKYVVKWIIDPYLRKNKHMCWSFMVDKSNYDKLLPENVLEFLRWN